MVGVHPLEAVYACIYSAIWYAASHCDLIPGWFRTVVHCWILLELLFLVYGKVRHARLGRPWPLTIDPDHLERTLERFLTLADVFPFEEYLTGWFFGAPLESICRENVLDYVLYGLMYKTKESTSPEELARVDAFLSKVESRWGVRLTPGHNPALRYMRHSWEPLRVYPKPLLVYLVVEALGRGAHGLLRWQGFHQSTEAGFKFWLLRPRDAGEARAAEPLPALSPRRLAAAAGRTRSAALDATLDLASKATAAVSAQYPHDHQQYHMPVDASPLGAGGRGTGAGEGHDVGEGAHPPRAGRSTGAARDPRTRDSSADGAPAPAGPGAPAAALPALRSLSAAQLPIVFLHGVGFGVLPYLHFLRAIVKSHPGHPLLLVEVPHVSLRLCWQAAEVDEVARALAAALERHGFSRAVVMGHSYGTFVASRFTQLFPKMVHSLVIMDPVCMLVCYPQLLHNFIYRRPSRENFTSVSGSLDLIRFFCSRDLTISQAFCRKFNWAELMLWPDDIPERCLVVVSGLDDLVPSALVVRQLQAAKHPAKIMHHPLLGHGGILLLNNWQRQVIASMGQFLKEV
ncbi:hypothetical protein ACKKBG_A01950 [Auxenochlorella protothecoides x Auxenochlorella symbiontica]